MIEFLRTIKHKLDSLKAHYLPTTLVLGDSHTCIFKRWPFTVFFPTTNFRVCMVAGATVSGLENPNSMTRAMPLFMEALNSTKSNQIIVNLGEVDTGYVIWYRAEKYSLSVDEMLNNAVAKYQEFLKLLKSKSEVCVISAPLPTIEDGNDWGDIANLRKDVQTTQVQRTSLTLKFNQLMEQFCQDNQILYLNLDSQCLGKNGVLKDTLKNKNRRDHHYDYSAYSYIVIKALYKAVILKWYRRFFGFSNLRKGNGVAK